LNRQKESKTMWIGSATIGYMNPDQGLRTSAQGQPRDQPMG
jgi:hypothetical protein